VNEIDIKGLNRDFESRVRLGIMSVLTVSGEVTFNDMKQMLDLSDGNLSSHANALEQNGYIEVRKSFAGKKPQTLYIITKSGRDAFSRHIEALSRMIGKI
jgi:DNA-binding MarR family transcriptional regulator